MISIIVSNVLMICMFACFIGYMLLKTKYPAKGVRVVTNLLKNRISFTEAIEQLKQGKRIKRLSSRQGFVKMKKMAGDYNEEVFAKYRISDPKPSEDRIIFDMEDVLANDWIIDE